MASTNPFGLLILFWESEMNWLKELFFYDAETFSLSQFVLDACVAVGLLLMLWVSIWLAYAIFG